MVTYTAEVQTEYLTRINNTRAFNAFNPWPIVRSQKYQNTYMHIYLYFESWILVPDDGP